jgi:hypothetical protein
VAKSVLREKVSHVGELRRTLPRQSRRVKKRSLKKQTKKRGAGPGRALLLFVGPQVDIGGPPSQRGTPCRAQSPWV